ncbi:MAG: C1 family peptidase [Clostridiales bacterium]|nr:C1 family peptidase [Clostridiales bacterium]
MDERVSSCITQEELKRFAADFQKNPANVLAMNTVTANGLNKSARRYEAFRNASHEYSVSLDQNGITWQKQSGRCWMFAGHNFLRDRVIKKLNLSEFAFSGSYLMFYDKLEKANFFLEGVIKYIEEPADSRMVMSLMQSVRSDGGEWEMFVSLVQKYGVVPADAQPEAVSTEESRSMAPVVQEKLREFARDLREGYRAGKTVEQLREDKTQMMNTIYRMYCICYGEPVKTFDFKVRDKDGNFICDRGITPLAFYEKYVGVDLEQYVNLTAGSSNGRELKKYFYPDAGDVIEGKPISYVSVPVEMLKKTVVAQLEDGEPVWFGCDVGKCSLRDNGILDDEIFDYEGLFGISLAMTREDRFAYAEAQMSHAMVLKGVDIDEKGKTVSWRVENSWGPDVGKKGMFTMTDSWFDKYTYQVIINRKHVPEDVLAVYDGEEATALDKWQINI